MTCKASVNDLCDNRRFFIFTHSPYYIYNQTVKKLRFFADLLAIFRRLYFFADYQVVICSLENGASAYRLEDKRQGKHF